MHSLKQFFIYLALSVCLLAGLSNCSDRQADTDGVEIRTPEDLNKPEMIIGGETGTVSLYIAKDKLPKSQYLEFFDLTDLCEALVRGKIDAVVYDRPPAEYATRKREGLIRLPKTIGTVNICVAAQLGNHALMNRVNNFIDQYRADGTYDDMYHRWVNSENPQMPDIPVPANPDGELLVGSNTENEPMCFVGPGGKATGFDIEFAKRLALALNKRLELKIMDYDALFPAAASGKVDLSIAQLDATPERAESVLFSNPYIDSPVTLIVRQENYPGAADSASTGRVQEYTQLAELQDKKVGVWTGTIADKLTAKHFPHAKTEHYSKPADLALALKNRKIDFFPIEEPLGQLMQLRQPHLCIMKDAMVERWDYAFAFPRGNSELCDAFSQEIRNFKADGTLEKLRNKWFTADSNTPQMTVRKPGSKGVLRIGTVPELEPFTYLRNGEFVGMDLDLAAAVAEKLGYSVEFVMLDFASFIEALNTGKVDMVASCITVTEERKEQILFSESHYLGGCVLMIRNLARGRAAKAGHHWWQELCASFERTFVREERWRLVLEGLGITIIITLAASALGTLLGFPVWLLRTARTGWLQSMGRSYVAIMQGTPILVILMILYYVIFAHVEIDSILVATIGFGLNFSAYVGEMLRSGINSVPKGQQEAAMALGFSKFQTFRKIVMPQALRLILPVYRGEFISLLKNTSIVGYIAIQDLTKMSDIIRSRTYEAFFPLIATAVIYFLTAAALASVLNYLEYRLNPKNRRRTDSDMLSD